MPMMKPRMVASTQPMPETSNVLRSPTQNARPNVEVLDEKAIRVWLMSKPAVLFQKPKPWAILARAMFCAALWAAATASPTTMTSSAACSAKLPTPCEKRRRGRAISARAISAMGRPVAAATPGQATYPLANGQAVLQAALGQQRVEAARDLQRRALADIALKNFTIITDRLDDAI